MRHRAKFRSNRPNCCWDMAYFRFFKMAAAAILKGRKIAICRQHFERFRQNLARWRSPTLLTSPTVNNLTRYCKTDCLSSKPDFHFRGVKKYTMLADTTLHNFLLLSLHFQSRRDRRFCKKGQVHVLVTVWNISTEFGKDRPKCHYSRSWRRQLPCWILKISVYLEHYMT